jgi:hypothetical protein
MKLFPLLLTTLFASIIVFGQAKLSPSKNKIPAHTNKVPGKTTNKSNPKTSTVMIDIWSKEAFQQINVTDAGLVTINKLPDTLIISFPSPFDKYSIQFNNDTSKHMFRANFFSNEENDSILYINEGWLPDGKLKLVFDKNDIIGIMGRPYPITGKSLDVDKNGNSYIKIIDTSSTVEVVKNNTKAAIGLLRPSTDTTQKILQIDTSKNIICHFICDSVYCTTCKGTDIADSICKSLKCNVEVVQSLANQIYLTPCLAKGGPAVSNDYAIVYDTREGNSSSPLYLKLNRKKGVEYYSVLKSEKFIPKANTEIGVILIRDKDTLYSVNSSPVNNFLDSTTALIKQLGLGSNPAASLVQETPRTAAVADTTKGKHADSTKSFLPAISTEAMHYTATGLKIELVNLFSCLHDFNRKYPTIDFKQKQYLYDLSCIKNKIVQYFSIVPSDSVNALYNSLVVLAKQTLDKDTIYYNDFNDIITVIQSEYTLAINKQFRYASYYSRPSIRVPDADSVKITIKKLKGNDDPVILTYPIKGGWKIDISSGVFVHGISASTFTLGQHSFRYKVTTDSILPTGTDSTIYTGKVADTSGNLIHKNDGRLNYSIGLLINCYHRSGKNLNIGASLGAMLDNNSRVLFVLGPTIMVTNGKNRIALVAGVVTGQESVLTSVNSQYTWNPASDPDNRLYNSRYEIPKLYSGTNDLATFTSWKVSWFAGFSYNFGSK